MKGYERLEAEAADLLLELGRVRRENARLRRKLAECARHVRAAAFELDETRMDVMELRREI